MKDDQLGLVCVQVGFGDVAVVKADWIFQRKGSDKQQRGPVTIVYVLEDKYRIAHAHFNNY